MPIEFADLITVEQFHYLSGMAGICAAFVMFNIWGQGL